METRQLTPSTFKQTPAQLALSCAQLCYAARHDDATYDEPLREKLTGHIAAEFKAIISCVVDQASCDALGWHKFDQKKINNNPVAVDQKSYVIGGKLDHFNERGELMLDVESVAELTTFFDSFTIKNAGHVQELNEYSGDKVSSVSNRRLAALSGGYALVGCNLAAMVSDFDEIDYFFDDADFTSDEIGNDVISMAFKVGFSYFVAANFYKYVRQSRTSDFVRMVRLSMTQALTKLATLEGFYVTKDHYYGVNELSNILLVKGNISAQASKVRRRFTLGVSLTLAAIFYTLDGFTLSFSLWSRILIAGGAGIASTAARYYSKWEQNKRKLYDKQYRMLITVAFSSRMRAELKVFGLDPVDANFILRSGTADQKRRVQVDVETYLNDHMQAILNIKSALLGGNENPSLELREELLKALKAFAKKNMMPEYIGCSYYFMLEFSFQIRQEYLNENAEMIDAERQEEFAQYLVQFVGRQDAKSISRYNQYILLDKASPLMALKEERDCIEVRVENFDNLVEDFVRRVELNALSGYEKEMFFRKFNAIYTEVQRSDKSKVAWSNKLAQLLTRIDWKERPEKYDALIKELKTFLKEPEEKKESLDEDKSQEIATNYEEVYVPTKKQILQEIQTKFPRITQDSFFGRATDVTEKSLKERMRSSPDFARQKRLRHGIYPWQEQSKQVQDNAFDAYYTKHYMEARRRVSSKKTATKIKFNWALLDQEKPFTVCGKKFSFDDGAVVREINKGFPRITQDSFFGREPKATKDSLKKIIKNSWRFTFHKYMHCNLLPWESVTQEDNDTMLDAYYRKLERQAKQTLVTKKSGGVTNFHKSCDQLFEELLEKPGMKEKHKENMTGVAESSMWSGVRSTVCASIALMFPLLPEVWEGLSSMWQRVVTSLSLSVLTGATSGLFVWWAVLRARLSKSLKRLENIPVTKEDSNKITSTLMDYSLYKSVPNGEGRTLSSDSVHSVPSS